MIEVLVIQPLLSILEGRVVLSLGAAHTLQVAQTLSMGLNLVILEMMSHSKLEAAQSQPATKKRAKYMVNNFIGKSL